MSLMAVSAAVSLTACGGGASDDFSALAASAPKSATQASRTLGAKPIDKFGNFNPSIWDEHNWYECNCSRNPDTTPSTSTPWQAG